MKIEVQAVSILLLLGHASLTALQSDKESTRNGLRKLEEEARNVVEADEIRLPPLPEEVAQKLAPVVDLFNNLYPVVPCSEDGELPDDYKLPSTSIEMVDEWFLQHFGSIEEPLERYEPSVVLVVGGSSGTGRAIACYWASRGKTVMSLGYRPAHMAGKNLATEIDCPETDSIINVQYDMAQPEKQPSLASILTKHGITWIDFLLLNAGRDAPGNLRDWSYEDLTRAWMNNVFGLHEVWRQARKFLNPERAIVFGTSSSSIDNKYITSRQVYAIGKKSLYDLILSYAQEEEFVQPNTHYAAIIQGAINSNFGLTQIRPAKSKCTAQYILNGLPTSVGLQVTTILDVNEIATWFHKGFARIAAAKDMNPTARKDIPQSFSFESELFDYPPSVLMFNNHYLRPEEYTACVSEAWDQASEYLKGGCVDEDTGKMMCPFIGDIVVPMLDGRVPLQCSAV